MKKKGQIIMLLFAMCMMQEGLVAQNKQAKAIEKRVRQLEADYNAGKAEAFADVFSSKLYNEDQRKGLIDQVKQTHQFYNVTYRIDLEKIDADKKMGYEKGAFTLTLKPKNGGSETVQTFKFLDIWELESDGKWRITNAIKHLVDQPTTKVTASEVSAQLKPFIGRYEVQGTTAEISASAEESLILQVPGQPQFELVQEKGDKYIIKNYPSIYVQFKRDAAKKVTEFELNQPQGVITMKKIK